MSNPARRPYLSEAVHYQSYGTPGGEYPTACRAALITEPHEDGTAALTVFNPTGIFMHENLEHDENRAPGSWHFAH
jgi:hypothetical protein